MFPMTGESPSLPSPAACGPPPRPAPPAPARDGRDRPLWPVLAWAAMAAASVAVSVAPAFCSAFAPPALPAGPPTPDAVILEPVPVLAPFVPSTEVLTSYVSYDRDGDVETQADLQIKTKGNATGALSLDAMGAVSRVWCTDDGDLRRIKLSSRRFAKSVAATWAPGLLLMVSHHWGCGDGPAEVHFQLLDEPPKVDDKSLMVDLKARRVADPAPFIDSFDLKVGKPDQQVRRMAKRGLSMNRPEFLNMTLDLLYDKETGKSSWPDIQMVAANWWEPNFEVACANCYSHGRLKVGLRAKGSLTNLEILTVELHGDWTLNLEMSVNFRKHLYKHKFWSKTLWTLPLTPFYIPKFFHIGPALVLKSKVDANVNAPLSVTSGIRFQAENFSVKADLLKQEYDHHVDSRKFEIFPVSVNVSDARSIDFVAHLVPMLTMDLTVWWKLTEVGFGMDAYSGLSVPLHKSRCESSDAEIATIAGVDLGIEAFGEFKSLKNFGVPRLPYACVPCGIDVSVGNVFSNFTVGGPSPVVNKTLAESGKSSVPDGGKEPASSKEFAADCPQVATASDPLDDDPGCEGAPGAVSPIPVRAAAADASPPAPAVPSSPPQVAAPAAALPDVDPESDASPASAFQKFIVQGVAGSGFPRAGLELVSASDAPAPPPPPPPPVVSADGPLVRSPAFSAAQVALVAP